LWLFCLFSILFSQKQAMNQLPVFKEIPIENDNANPIYVAWGDYNNDNLIDLYICNSFSQPNQLLKNNGNGEFINVTENAQRQNLANSLIALWVDLNDDKWLDLFLINIKYENHLYQNKGDGTFQEIYTQTGLNKGHPAIVDINGDGLLDIYMARGRKLYSSALKNQLFYNSGNFKFIAAPEKSFLIKDEYFDWPNWIDPGNDFKPDLFVANTTSEAAKQNHIFRNNGDSTFNQFNPDAIEIGLTGDNQSGDLDNDGDQDLIIFEFKGHRFCFCENKNGQFVRRTVKTAFMPASDGQEQEFWESLKLIDFDFDGRLDLQVRIHPVYSENALRIRLFRNMGNFNFEEIENVFSPPGINWIEDISWADIDNDGDLDCAVLYKNQIKLYQNQGTGNNFIRILLQGTDTNHDGIGARIEVTTRERKITNWVGFGNRLNWFIRNQNIIGLGRAQFIPKIKIIWPSGVIQDTSNIAVNQDIIFKEPATKWFVDQSAISKLNDFIGKSLGATCADYDNDGNIDLFVNNHAENSYLYRNKGKGIFENVTENAKIILDIRQMGSLFFDYNNDGFKDLLLIQSYLGHLLLYKNTGQNQFIDVTNASQVNQGTDSSFSAIAADFDQDGFLDLYIGRNRKNRLLKNSQTGTFIDITESSGTGDPYFAHGMVAFDYDKDGDLDIYVANTRGPDLNYHYKSWPNALLENRGNFTFVNVTEKAGVVCKANSKGVCAGDYDNDGNFDLFIANDDTANILFKNNGNGTFSDITATANVAPPPGAHGCQLVDFNNDGYLDLYVAGSSYWPEQPRKDRVLKRDNPDILYRNNQNGTFTDITRFSGIEKNVVHTPHIVVADFNKDGYPDVFVTGSVDQQQKPTPNKYFENRCHGNNWLQIKLQGYQSNFDGVGAKVRLVIGDKELWQEVSHGAGYGSGRSDILTFGLGNEKTVDVIEVFWPSSSESLIRKVNANQLLKIEEPFYLWFFSIERDIIHQVKMWSSLLLMSGLFVVLLYKIVPLVQKGLQVQKQEQLEHQFRYVAFTKQPSVLEVRIDLPQFINDYFMSYFIRPGTADLFKTKLFTWERQGKTVVQLKQEKMIMLKFHLEEILRKYQNCIQNPPIESVNILEELKRIGSRIYQNLGLNGFFDTLFSSQKFESIHLNFFVDSLMIPWHLAYHEKSDSFFCERFAYSYSYSLEKSHLNSTFLESKKSTPDSQTQKSGIILFAPWEKHQKYLPVVEQEVKELSRFFNNHRIDLEKIDSDSDKFIQTVQKMNKDAKNLRFIHYSGHIEHHILALGPENIIDTSHFEKNFPISFDSNPIIFLNGCQTSNFGDEVVDSLTQNFLDAGASACIVTHAKIPESTAKKFAILFYHYFIAENFTIAESLRRSRLAILDEKGLDPHFDLTRYFYNLFGDPLVRF